MLYFDKCQKPNICIVNKSTIDIGDFGAMVDALRKYNDLYLSNAWGTPANIVESASVLPGYWGFVLCDSPESSISLGYSNCTADGLPLNKIFVKTILSNKQSISVVVSHGLAEILVDPGINLCAINSSTNNIYSLDICDAVENQDFLVDGFRMSNFVYPSWFENFRRPGCSKFDQLGMIDRPFKISKGGHMNIITSKGKCVHVYGSKEKEKDFREKEHTSSRHVKKARNKVGMDSREKSSLWNRFCGLFIG